VNSPDPQTLRFNRLLERELRRLPPWHTLSPVELRERLAEGVMGPPPPRRDDVAEDRTIEGPEGPIPLRVFVPNEVQGVLLHIHGGGFVTGGHDHQDEQLWERAQDGCLAVVSVGYRLAPEHPWPAANDDCEAAALWVLEHARELGGEHVLIAGESAGAHLAVATLLRLRDEHGIRELSGAALTYGVYDLRGTPSARNWGERPLLLSTPLIDYYANHYAPPAERLNPDVSPLFADLSGLPPALFSVGTEDPLFDDTQFMATRWRAAGNPTELRVYPGAPHSFDTLPLPVGREGALAITHFLARCLG